MYLPLCRNDQETISYFDFLLEKHHKCHVSVVDIDTSALVGVAITALIQKLIKMVLLVG